MTLALHLNPSLRIAMLSKDHITEGSTYYAQGENAVRTAEALGLHRNTVRQRIAKLENDRAGFRGDALQIALALRVYDDFDPIDPTQGGG